METYLPYIVTVVCSIIAGFASYFSAIHKSKLDNEIKIKEIQEQHKLDLSNQKEMFKLEIDKINLQHQNELEKMKVDSDNQLNNNLTSTLVSSLFNNPKGISDLVELSKQIDKTKK